METRRRKEEEERRKQEEIERKNAVSVTPIAFIHWLALIFQLSLAIVTSL